MKRKFYHKEVVINTVLTGYFSLITYGFGMLVYKTVIYIVEVGNI